MKHGRRALLGALMGTCLVGCSLFSVEGSRRMGQAFEPAPSPAPRAERDAAIFAAAGLSPVIVEQTEPGRARITWREPRRGESVVFYGETPRLVPFRARAERTWGSRVELEGLAPNTRYYFVVETRSMLDVSRTAVCSFLTR